MKAAQTHTTKNAKVAMFDWESWNRERIELNSHPEKHIPVFGGMGKTLCGIISYTYGSLVDKPLCPICKEAQAKIKAAKRKRS